MGSKRLSSITPFWVCSVRGRVDNKEKNRNGYEVERKTDEFLQDDREKNMGFNHKLCLILFFAVQYTISLVFCKSFKNCWSAAKSGCHFSIRRRRR